MKKAILILALLVAPHCSGESLFATDKVAHFGVSFALNTMFYGLYKKGLKQDDDRLRTIILSAATTLAIGFAKEALDKVKSGNLRQPFGTTDMLANVAGTAASSVVILSFDF